MMDLDSQLNELAESFKASRLKRELIAKKISSLDQKSLFRNIEKKDLNRKISAVDSGFISVSFHTVDLLLIRSCGVTFTFENNSLKKADYYPSFYSLPEAYFSTQPLENDEFQALKSLTRLKEEIMTALKILYAHKPDLLLLDGSILPQYADKPRNDSKVRDLFNEVISLYEDLYASTTKEDCTLVGCVEDSRGAVFSNHLEKMFPERFSSLEVSDSALLSSVLKKDQATVPIHYSNNPNEHGILKNFKERWQSSVMVAYLRPSLLDRPLRIEFLKADEEKLNEIFSTILSLSSLHKEYAFPSILIEADLRAGLHPEEIKTVSEKIMDRLGRETLLLRRNSRPFR